MSAGAAIVLTLPVEGSLVLGASLARGGQFFLGVAAVGGQVATPSRGANGIAAAAIGTAFVLRSVGDLNGDGTTPGWISGASPLG